MILAPNAVTHTQIYRFWQIIKAWKLSIPSDKRLNCHTIRIHTNHILYVNGKDFFILEGEINIVVDGVVHHLKQGDFIHIEPSEVHYCFNPYKSRVKMISTLAPYQQVDKVEVEDYTF